MSDNLYIYQSARQVPKEAQKTINGGRLNGKTDINPMWRIKLLTELFGPCGFGWKYVITKQWTEQGTGGEIAAFCNIDLFIYYSGSWSDAIPGTGGSAFVAKENKGLYTSDECFKMALTDAISVACKALGIGADIYWSADRTKYDQRQTQPQDKKQEPAPQLPLVDVDPALLPGGVRFNHAVEMYATGQMCGRKTAREMWSKNIKATPEQLAAFDDAVVNYRVNNNI